MAPAMVFCLMLYLGHWGYALGFAAALVLVMVLRHLHSKVDALSALPGEHLVGVVLTVVLVPVLACAIFFHPSVPPPEALSSPNPPVLLSGDSPSSSLSISSFLTSAQRLEELDAAYGPRMPLRLLGRLRGWQYARVGDPLRSVIIQTNEGRLAVLQCQFACPPTTGQLREVMDGNGTEWKRTRSGFLPSIQLGPDNYASAEGRTMTVIASNVNVYFEP